METLNRSETQVLKNGYLRVFKVPQTYSDLRTESSLSRMKDVKDVTALIVDHGLFLPLALKLAKTYKRVLYHTPWEKGFPLVNDCIIGDGFDEIERCNDIWKAKAEVDVWIFPDIQNSGLQLELESQDCAVWGSRAGDSLEINRQKFHGILSDIGLAVPQYVEMTGLDNLRQYLRGAENKYLKMSKYRGSFESYHWRNQDLDGGMFDVWAVRFGPAQNLIKIMVCDPIETTLEVGGDTFGVDGQWPSLMLHGDEQKDKGYLGTVTKREKMPEQVQAVLEAFSPVLKDFRYRNFWSMELRDEYFIDPCCRGGLPSIGAQMETWGNLAEIIWAGANGELMEPEPMDQVVAECVLTMKSEKQAWGKTVIPEELEGFCKFGSCCKIDGAICFPPDDSHGEEVGWLVITGPTIAAVADAMKEKVALLPEGLNASTDSLYDLIQSIQEGEQEGIEFGKQTIPNPSVALESV